MSVRHRGRVLLPLLLAVLLVATGCDGDASRSEPGRDTPLGIPSNTGGTTVKPKPGRPNIVFVLTDDLSSDLIRYMPHVQALRRTGTSFANYTVTDSLCCPSRASIFSGRFPHNTGVYENLGPDGGFGAFHRNGQEEKTFAVALQQQGYRTAMMGKYLNGYRTRGTVEGQKNYVPPGWDEWDVVGNGYGEYDYRLNHNGQVKSFGSKPEDYLTDVLSDAGSRFIEDSAKGERPFFLEVSTFAPHVPATPAPQDEGSFADLKAPRGPAFDRLPKRAPRWLRSQGPLDRSEQTLIDDYFRKRVESVQSVDRMIGTLQTTLAATGEADDTVVVFASDNGYHLGQYRLAPGKQTAFDTDVVVPLVAAGPDIPAGTVVDEPVQNIDLAPTFVTLAGGRPAADVDGRSMVGLLQGDTEPDWRTAALIEHRGPRNDDPGDPDRPIAGSGDPPTYQAMRTERFTYVEYVTGEREYYDRVRDPRQLDNRYATLSPQRRAALARQVERLTACQGRAECWPASRGPAS